MQALNSVFEAEALEPNLSPGAQALNWSFWASTLEPKPQVDNSELQAWDQSPKALQ